MYDYMENLKKQRFLKIDRQRAGITAHRILKIYENKVDIAVKPILSKTGSITVPMNDTSGLQVGDYLDFQFSYTIHGGRVNNYQMMFCGKTPPQFIPKEEA
jgi:hypothetical protein